MKVAVADPRSSAPLRSLCLHYLAMDRLSVGVAVHDSGRLLHHRHHHLPHHHQQQQQQQVDEQETPSWWSRDAAAAAAAASLESNSDHLFSISPTSYPSSDHHKPFPKSTSLLASIGALSSCTELSEDELRLAEVNPITFEPRHQPDFVPGLAEPQEQSMDISCSAPCQSQPPFRLSSDDGDLASSDGQSSPLAVYLSECHCGRPSSPSMPLHRSSHPSEDTSSSRVKLMCSFGGKIMPRPIDAKLRYVGGETRIVAVSRSIGYKDFMSKMAHLYGVNLALKYQLPDEDLDALVSVSSDDDLQNMMEEYDKLESGGGASRLRLFFFTSPAEYEMSQIGFQSETEDEQRYVDAINGVPVKLSADHLEGDAPQADGLHNFAESSARFPHDAASAWSCTPVKTLSRNPSAPSSSPSSPPVVSKQVHLKPSGLGDSSLQILNERLNKVNINSHGFEGSSHDVDQDGSGSSSGTSYCDHQYRLHAESPRRTNHDMPVSRGETWRISEVGMHRVDSQTKLLRQSEQHIDRCTGAGPVDAWHDVHEQPPEMLLPQKELQRFVLQHQKQIPQQQQPDWQSQMEVNLARGEMLPHSHSDTHKQPQAFHHPHQAIQQPHQAPHFNLHPTGAGHDGSFWNSEHQPIPLPILQGSVQSHSQVPIGLAPTSTYQMGSAPTSPRVEAHLHQAHQAAHLILHQTVAGHDGGSRNEHQPIHGSMHSHAQLPIGLAPMPLYQMGSAPTSPKIAVQDYQGRCNCAQQHMQVHRGINVSLGEQSYSRRQPHFGDQHSRNQGLHNSMWFCDNPSHCLEPLVWQQQPSHCTALEAEQQGQIGNPWQHVHERHIAQYHGAECQARNRASQYCGAPVFTEAFLPSHDPHETRKARHPCLDCHDYRRQQQHVEMAVGHPIYTDIQHQVGDWAMHQRNVELEEGRVSAVGRTYGKIPMQKDEDRRGEIEVEEWVDSEPDLYCSHPHVEFESKGPQTLAATGGLHRSKFPVQVAPISRPVVSEDLQASQVSPTLPHGESAWHTKLVAPKLSAAMPDLWNRSSLEPQGWSDLLPSTAQASERVMQEKVCEITHSKAVPRANAMDAVGSLENNLIHQICTQKHVQDNSGTWSLLRDGSGRSIPPGGVIGEAATDLLPVCSLTHEFSDSRCDGIRDPGMNGGAHVVSYDVIPTGSLAPQQDTSSALPSWRAFPPGTYNVMTLDGSLNTLAVPIYDQSPLGSINTTDFSFEPHEASTTPGGANVETEAFTSRMSFTGILAGGMISSVLESCSNEGGCEEGRDDHDVGNKTIHEVNKNETEQGSGIAEVGSLLLPSTVHRQGWSLMKVDTANDWLKVGVEEHNLVGIVQESQSDVINDVANKENHTEIGSVSAKEPERLAFTPAEEEAKALGLQIIRNADLEDMRELGSGTFGTVFHGKWRGSDVAIKRIKASCFTAQPSEQERLISDFWKEACTLAQLHHPNVVAFYGVVPDGPGGTLATVTEYMVNGSLKQVLHKKDRTIDRRKRLLIAMDAAFGMEYLHSKNIVHFDLKCENLLVNMRDAHRPICKVGDFGLSKVKHQTLVSGGVRGTLPWMAPELLCGNNSMVTEKIDVYSFGVVMWELLTGEEPYANMHCGAIIGGIVNNSLRPPIPCWCDPGWRTLMEKCWSADPADRPAFTEVARELRAIAASMNVK